MPPAAAAAAPSLQEGVTSMVRELLAATSTLPVGTKIAVAEITASDRARSAFGRLLSERVQTELTRASAGRLTVVERRRIDALEQEGEAFANRKLDALAKRMGVPLLVTGTYTTTGRRAFVDARILDTTSAETRAAASTEVLLDAELERLSGGRPTEPSTSGRVLGGDVLAVLADSGAARGMSVEVWPDRGEGAKYRAGDTLAVSFRATRDAYVTILDFQTSGQVVTLFPNCMNADNRVRGGGVYTVPGPADGYDLVVGHPPGIERIKAIASERAHPVSEPPLCDRQAFGSIGTNERPRFRDLSLRVKAIEPSEKTTANTWLEVE